MPREYPTIEEIFRLFGAKTRGLETQTSFAESIGVSQSDISNGETMARSDRAFSKEVIDKIVRAKFRSTSLAFLEMLNIAIQLELGFVESPPPGEGFDAVEMFGSWVSSEFGQKMKKKQDKKKEKAKKDSNVSNVVDIKKDNDDDKDPESKG